MTFWGTFWVSHLLAGYYRRPPALAQAAAQPEAALLLGARDAAAGQLAATARGDLDEQDRARLLFDPLPDRWAPYEFGPPLAGRRRAA